jgi:uncharacterized protein YchJ
MHNANVVAFGRKVAKASPEYRVAFTVGRFTYAMTTAQPKHDADKLATTVKELASWVGLKVTARKIQVKD